MGEGSDLPSWARAGQKVVCIKVDGWKDPGQNGPDLVDPKFGDVLTIAFVFQKPASGDWFLNFVETAPLDLFWVGHFRPLTEDDTEAELFRAKRPGQGEDAPVRDTVPA